MSQIIFDKLTKTPTVLATGRSKRPDATGVVDGKKEKKEEKKESKPVDFFAKGNELRLIRRDGTILNRWPVEFSRIFPNPRHLSKPPKTDWNVDIHGALALPDGSVIFNFEYAGLVKLDRCGNIIWRLEKATHHSVELSEDGGFWVPSWLYHPKENNTPFPPFQTPFADNTVMKVSTNGEIVNEFSVPKLFYDNGSLRNRKCLIHLGNYCSDVRCSKVWAETRDVWLRGQWICQDFRSFPELFRCDGC